MSFRSFPASRDPRCSRARAGGAGCPLFALRSGLDQSPQLMPQRASKRSRLLFFETIFFVASPAVVLADIRERRLEGIEVFYGLTRGLGISTELRKPRFEVIHVFPYFWAGAVRIVRGGLINGILRPQCSHLGCGLLELCEH